MHEHLKCNLGFVLVEVCGRGFVLCIYMMSKHNLIHVCSILPAENKLTTAVFIILPVEFHLP